MYCTFKSVSFLNICFEVNTTTEMYAYCKYYYVFFGQLTIIGLQRWHKQDAVTITIYCICLYFDIHSLFPILFAVITKTLDGITGKLPNTQSRLHCSYWLRVSCVFMCVLQIKKYNSTATILFFFLYSKDFFLVGSQIITLAVVLQQV